jgi:hypothetical protein
VVQTLGALLSSAAKERAKKLRPHPEERAPKSGLPDFGNLKVSKSATADFDARVSKDGGEQRNRLLPISAILVPKSGRPDFGRRASILRDASLRDAPQDEV